MRLYNGCPDNELKAILDSQAAAHKEARDMGYIITWFPVEEKYAAARVSDWALVGPYCRSPEECLIYAKEHAASEAAKEREQGGASRSSPS